MSEIKEDRKEHVRLQQVDESPYLFYDNEDRELERIKIRFGSKLNEHDVIVSVAFFHQMRREIDAFDDLLTERGLT